MNYAINDGILRAEKTVVDTFSHSFIMFFMLNSRKAPCKIG